MTPFVLFLFSCTKPVTPTTAMDTAPAAPQVAAASATATRKTYAQTCGSYDLDLSGQFTGRPYGRLMTPQDAVLLVAKIDGDWQYTSCLLRKNSCRDAVAPGDLVGCADLHHCCNLENYVNQ